MADDEPRPVPDDPLEWAPMRAYTGRRSFEIKDPIVEPLWSGTRALAHVTVDPEAEPPARVRLIEQLGGALGVKKLHLQQKWEHAALRTRLKELEYSLKMQRKRLGLLMQQLQLQTQPA